MKSGKLPALILAALLLIVFSAPLHAKEAKVATPKEFGVYVMSNKVLKRLLPNIVFDEKEILYVEMNNPQRFLLKDIDYFVFYGKYDLKVLTLNPMNFLGSSRLGKPRFGFGKAEDLDVKQAGADLYTVKPKGLLGRGYFAIWINDTAWDFIVE
jgi:hypothetical protein